MQNPFPLNRRIPRASVKQPLRIALISVHGDPLMPMGAEEAGGQNVYVREVAQALAARGHSVDVFTRGRDCCAPEIHALGGARVIRLPAGPRGFISRIALAPHLGDFVSAMTAFAEREGVHYDVLHTNYWLSGWVGMQLARSWRIPQTHTHHSLGAVKFATTGTIPASGAMRLQVEDTLSLLCARIIATSPQDVASLERYYRHPARTAIIPCGVDEAILTPVDAAESRAALGLAADVPVIGYVGRFDPAKGIETLLRAAARVAAERPVQLVLAGGFDPDAPDAREYSRIQALAVSLGLEAFTHFLGQADRAQLARVYAAADLVAVPSHYESFGLVAIEAMGAGTPVVASDVGGLRYTVIHRETGLLVPPQDEVAFAAGFRCLLDDAALRTRMGQAGRRLVGELFTWRAVATRLEGLYGEVVTQTSRTANRAV